MMDLRLWTAWPPEQVLRTVVFVERDHRLMLAWTPLIVPIDNPGIERVLEYLVERTEGERTTARFAVFGRSKTPFVVQPLMYLADTEGAKLDDTSLHGLDASAVQARVDSAMQDLKNARIAGGINAVPGAAAGKVVFTAAEAEEMAAE